MVANCIWTPRYWDRKVLVATNKVGNRKCYLYFSSDDNYPYLYSYDGEKVRNECSVCTNGKISCYEIPLDWLVNEGELPDEFLVVKEVNDKNYRKTQKVGKRKKA